MGDEHTLRLRVSMDMRFDEVASAAQIRCDIVGQVTHSGMKHIAFAGAVETAGIHDETLTKTVIKRQHLVLLGLFPPEIDQGGKPFRLLCRKIVGLGEVLVEMKRVSCYLIVRRARGMQGDCLPSRVPEPAVAEHLEILRPRFRWKCWMLEAWCKARALDRHLSHTVDLSRTFDPDQLQKRRRQIAGVGELVAEL